MPLLLKPPANKNISVCDNSLFKSEVFLLRQNAISTLIIHTLDFYSTHI